MDESKEKIRFEMAAMFGGRCWAPDDNGAKYYDEILGEPVVGKSAIIEIQGNVARTSTVMELGENGSFRTRSRWYIKRPADAEPHAFGPSEEQ